MTQSNAPVTTPRPWISLSQAEQDQVRIFRALLIMGLYEEFQTGFDVTMEESVLGETLKCSMWYEGCPANFCHVGLKVGIYSGSKTGFELIFIFARTHFNDDLGAAYRVHISHDYVLQQLAKTSGDHLSLQFKVCEEIYDVCEEVYYPIRDIIEYIDIDEFDPKRREPKVVDVDKKKAQILESFKRLSEYFGDTDNPYNTEPFSANSPYQVTNLYADRDYRI